MIQNNFVVSDSAMSGQYTYSFCSKIGNYCHKSMHAKNNGIRLAAMKVGCVLMGE